MMKVVVEPTHDTRRGYGDIQETLYLLDFLDNADPSRVKREEIWAKSDEEAREMAADRLAIRVDMRDKEVVRKARIFEITEEEL